MYTCMYKIKEEEKKKGGEEEKRGEKKEEFLISYKPKCIFLKKFALRGFPVAQLPAGHSTSIAFTSFRK